MAYAQLAGGVVIGMFAVSQPDIDTIEAPDVVTLGWGFADGAWTAPEVPPVSPEVATSAAWAEFNATTAALADRLSLANLHDGPGLVEAVSTIQTEFAAAVAKREAAIDAVWE